MSIATRTPCAIALACVVLFGCSAKDDSKGPNPVDAKSGATAPAPAAATVTKDPMTVVADPEVAKWLKVEPVRTVEFRESLRVPASVSVDETRVARIGASVTGRITELKAIVGQSVVKGQTLAMLNSTELSTAQLSFLKAFSSKQLAQRAADRAHQLFDADVIGLAELQRRQTELSQAEADLSASHDQLKVLGMSEAGIHKLEQSRTVNSQSFVVASISGMVIERTVAQGQVVQPADAVFTVADLSRLWVQAEVPEKQSDLVKVGDVVRVSIPALDNRTIDGKLVFVSSTVNPETRTVSVRTELANTDRSIRPAMLAVMMIQDRPTPRPVVPMNAVVRQDNKEFVFVRTAANTFRLVLVGLGVESNGLRPVLEGLKGGDEIVIDGAFHLENERKQHL
jgi:membrane fusion protein, heavy metal efflux system